MPPENMFTLEDTPLSVSSSGEAIDHTFTVPVEKAGQRLDQLVAEMFPQYSRSRFQQWIKDGALTLDGAQVKPKSRVSGGERVELRAREEPRGDWLPEPIELSIVHEDDSILVINKPAGLVVHPAAGNYSGTLLNGLLYHRAEQVNVPRAGIVHRLDKDTTGLMVVAKTDAAQLHLVNQLQARTVKRSYQAIVVGEVRQSGIVEAAIGRHPSARTRMAVVKYGGKEAVTHYRPIRQYPGFTHLELQLQTGRTHQIRVHMAHLGFPLVGDQTYGRRLPAKLLRAEPQLEHLAQFNRQALHAFKLGLLHPDSSEYCEWQVRLPEDMSGLLTLLKTI